MELLFLVVGYTGDWPGWWTSLRGVAMPDEPVVGFGGLLRRLRARAGLTQEELAEAAGLSARSVSDLERGVTLTARKDTSRLLADALGLEGSSRAEFEARARGRPTAGRLPVGGGAGATRTLPRDVALLPAGSANCASLWGRSA